jgi:hypothetical protein
MSDTAKPVRRTKLAKSRKDAKATQPNSAAPVNKTRRLEIVRVPGKTDDRVLADVVTDGLATNASTAIRYIQYEHGDVSLTDLVASLRDQGGAVNRGDLASAERMLSSQVVALNAIFCEMARRAALNMGEYLGPTEVYARLALKAQSQARATIETLAAIKNPPAVFARQANINNGGQQQVNNGVAARPVPFASRARDPESSETELLGATDGERMDPGAAGASSRADQVLAPVGAIDGTANG